MQKRDLKPLTVYLPPDLIGRLEAAAKLAERTTSAEVRRVLLEALPPPPLR